jgi:hypothetical protein
MKTAHPLLPRPLLILACSALSASLLPLALQAEEPLPSGFVQGPAAGEGWPQEKRPSSKPVRVKLTPEQREKAAEAAALAWGRVDVDADMNYDGEISNDSSDDGDLESSPPGLIVGKGEMSKLLLRLSPFKRVRAGAPASKTVSGPDIKVQMETRPIFLGSAKGTFPDAQAEAEKAGHIRIWTNEKREVLLLDSKDTNKRSVQWPLDDEQAPGSVYVETVEGSVPGSLHMLTVTMFKQGSNVTDPKNASDFILVTPRDQTVRRDPGPSGEGLPAMQGYGKYASFNKDDSSRDGNNVWVLVTDAKAP